MKTFLQNSASLESFLKAKWQMMRRRQVKDPLNLAVAKVTMEFDERIYDAAGNVVETQSAES